MSERNLWTADERATLERMAGEGYSAREIGQAVNRARNAVIGCCRRNGIVLHGGVPRVSEADVLKMRELRLEGKSYERIGNLLGRDEDTVRWYVTGQKDVSRPSISVVPKPKNSRAKRTRDGADADNSIIFRMRAERKRKPLKKPRKIIPDEQRKDLIGILDLTYTTCRWPIGERPVMYCGHEVEEGKSYCPRHHAIAYQKPVKQDISDELRDKRRAGMLKWWASQRGGKAA